MPSTSAVRVIAILLAGISPALAEDLADGFAQPPARARPQAYGWRWMDGNVSKEGITLDLEAMRAIGLGGVQKQDILGWKKPINPKGPVALDSPAHWELMRHAMAEAQRLGLEFTVMNCANWSASHGPWIPVEMGHRRLDTATTTVSGGTGTQRIRLPALRGWRNPGTTTDLAILAFPTPPHQASRMPSSGITASVGGTPADAALLHDGNIHQGIRIPKGSALVIDLGQSVRCASARLHGIGESDLVLEWSDDGTTFRPLSTWRGHRLWHPPREAPITCSFPATTLRQVRITTRQTDFQLTECALCGAAVIHDLGAKAHYYSQYEIIPDTVEPEPDARISSASVLDLTRQVGSDGVLIWDVPAGDYTVLRIAHGVVSHPQVTYEAGPYAGKPSHECDKLSATAVQRHFAGSALPLLEAASQAQARVDGILFDSFEADAMNWTPGFEAEFLRLRGYAIQPWLPVLAGVVVDSAAASERFLWDFRRTIGDLLDANYWGQYSRLARDHGLRTVAQVYGCDYRGPWDDVRSARHVDIPMAEFWGIQPGGMELVDGMDDAARIFGKRIVAAEAFTCAGMHWDIDPFAMKAKGDRMFSRGVNRFCFHTSAHQPERDPKPGINSLALDLHRGNTWFGQSGSYMTYLARCQFLLQQGQAAADLCYVYGEDCPIRLNTRLPALPEGYALDACPAEHAIAAMQVVAGQLTLPSGRRYRALLLPPDQYLTPELARKVRDLVQAGATVLGRRPIGSPSLVGQPGSDAEVQAIAAALWPTADTPGAMRPVGAGRVINAWDPSSIEHFRQNLQVQATSATMDAHLATILPALGILPRFAWQPVGAAAKDPEINWTQRHLDDGGALFFVANGRYAPISIAATFRVQGLEAQLWHADTGERLRAEAHPEGDGTRLRLDFAPAGSVFVLFRRPDPTLPAVRTWTTTHTVPVTGPWQVAFQEQRGAPATATFESLISWPTHADPGIRYFSGTATYTGSVVVPDGSTATRHVLDLGQVKHLASVTVNGQPFGVLWKAPFTVDVSRALRPGANTLTIAVTNLWINRFIGDEQLPADTVTYQTNWGVYLKEWPAWYLAGQPRPTARIAFGQNIFVRKDSPLVPSGLLGPVVVIGQQ